MFALNFTNEVNFMAQLWKGRFKKELAKEKEKPDGWKILIEHEQKELEMLTEFARILNG